MFDVESARPFTMKEVFGLDIVVNYVSDSPVRAFVIMSILTSRICAC